MSKPTFVERLESLIFDHRRRGDRPVRAGHARHGLVGRRACGSTPASPSCCRSSTPTWPTFLKHQQEFGGANRVLVALVASDGNMFTPEFFDALKGVTDEVFFLPGVDRGRVQSLFTPNVRYTEVVEDGIAAGNVIPDDFSPTPEGLEAVRGNILKAGIVGRLVANDFSGCDRQRRSCSRSTRRPARSSTSSPWRARSRRRCGSSSTPTSCPARRWTCTSSASPRWSATSPTGRRRVMLFFLVTPSLITALLVALYSQSRWLSVVVLACWVVAVIWQLGIDHRCSATASIRCRSWCRSWSSPSRSATACRWSARSGPRSSTAPTRLAAARTAFRRLLVPGSIALATDIDRFLHDPGHPDPGHPGDRRRRQPRRGDDPADQPGAAAGAALLRPAIDQRYHERLHRRARHMERLWRWFAGVTEPRPAAIIVAVTALLTALRPLEGQRGAGRRPAPRRARAARRLALQHRHRGGHLEVLDRRRHPERHRRDQAGRLRRPRGHDHDRRVLVAHGQHPGVQSTIDLARRRQDAQRRLERGQPEVARAGAQPVGPDPVGDLRADDDRPAQLRLQRHAGHDLHAPTTRPRRSSASSPRSSASRPSHGNPDVSFKLATGNVGVMAATNEAVAAAQFPMLVWVFGVGHPALPGDLPLGARHALHPAPARRSSRCSPTP